MGRAEEEAVIGVLRSGWLTTGKKTEQFETEFAGFTGTEYSLALNSATAGLHLALEAVGVKRGDKVITTPYTFASTGEVIRYLGADPLFVDIEEDTGNISPELLLKTLARFSKNDVKKIKAVIPVHFAGLPCAMERIVETAENYNLLIIEDSAHAFPVKLGRGKYRDKFAGTVGTAGVYSFYATKPITTGEGGMLVTNDRAIAERIKIMRLHGIDRDVFHRYNSLKSQWKYDIVAPGFKYNMTDIAAAIGLVQLKRALTLLERRRAVAKKYIDALSQYDFIDIPRFRTDHAWHLFVIRIKKEKLSVNRDEFIGHLIEAGIGISVHFIPLHIMTYYRKKYGYRAEDFPASYKKYAASISIPIYPGLTDSEVGRITDTIIRIGKQSYKRVVL